jgi:hypothetical protein
MSPNYGYPAGDKPASELKPPPPAACKPIPPIEPGIDKRIPPPTDNEWLKTEDIRTPHPTADAIMAEFAPPMTGGWFVTPKPRKAAHQCRLPQEWTLGALWRCSEGHLWVVERRSLMRGGYAPLAWWPASWRQRRECGPGMKRADFSMASRAVRVQKVPKRKPPKGPSGLSPSRDGRR